MKAYRGIRVMAPLVLNLDNRWRRDINFTSRPLYPRHPLNSRLCRTQSGSVHFVKQKYYLLLPCYIQQCQKALNDISTRHAVGLYWVPGRAGVRGNEIADELTTDGSALKSVGSEPALGVSRQDIRRRIRRWLVSPLAPELFFSILCLTTDPIHQGHEKRNP